MPTASAPQRAATPSSISAGSPGSAATATSRPRSARARSRSCAARRRPAATEGISRPWREHAAVGGRGGAGAGGRRPRLPAAACRPGRTRFRPRSCRSRARSSQPTIRPASRSSPATTSPTRRSRRRTDLDQYRIIHFATHGVVTSRAAKCAAQPALLTSFGGDGSDGLLTFREIFDLHLDADLVILSACDTAGKASAAATQQAGLATGGDVALDGLVRAFVGAGGAAGDRQPLAGAGRLQCDAAADYRAVLRAAGDSDGNRAADVAAPADGRRRRRRTRSTGRRSRRSGTAKFR